MMFYEEFLSEMTSESALEYKNSNGIGVSNVSYDFICPIHGVFSQKMAHHIQSKKRGFSGCPKCAQVRRVQGYQNRCFLNRSYSFSADILLDDCDKKLYNSKTLKMSSKVNVKCSRCSKVFSRFVSILKEPVLCKSCTSALTAYQQHCKFRQQHYPQWFINELAHEEDKQKARDGSLSTKQRVDFVCSKHGVYTQLVNDHLNLSEGYPNCGCPKCKVGSYRSSIELELSSILESNGIEIYHNVRGVIKNPDSNSWYELDIYIPSLHMAIEVNGSRYHSVNDKTLLFRKDPYYHQKKHKLCSDKGIRLINLFDVDWNNKKDLVLATILPPKMKVYARQTELVQIDSLSANKFFTENHLLGYSPGQCYALVYNGEIVSAMNFAKSRFSHFDGYEIKRFCNKLGFSVIGGASKLFSYFLKNTTGNILSYSDNDFFIGNVYKELGFNFDGFTVPSYYWSKNGREEVSRFLVQAHKLSQKYPELYSKAVGNKEDFIMTELGYFKVYRSGNRRWIYLR